MKTLNKLLALIIILASNMLFISINQAQQIWINPTAVFPAHDEFRSNQAIIEALGGNSSGPGYLNSFGLNNFYNTSSLPYYLPHFMFDVYCDPTNSTLQDINIGCPNCTPANSVGYRIGDSMIIWHNGILSSVFVGVDAGGFYPTPRGTENTFSPKFC
jgi:hypothetical protein